MSLLTLTESKLTPWNWIILEKPIMARLVKIFLVFVTIKLLPFSQDTVAGFYPEQNECNINHIFPSHAL
jgi:hypothetical protein